MKNTLQNIARWALAAVAVIFMIVVLVSLTNTDWWLVRTVDLMRERFLYLAIFLAVVCIAFVKQWKWPLAAAFAIVATINLYRIWPYVPFARTQIAFGGEAIDAQCFDALAVNVKVKNDNFDGVIRQIEMVKPDLLLLMETDERWSRELAVVTSRYSYVLSDIQPEAFGMIFATDLPVASARMIENTTRDTPTLYATIDLPNGKSFEFIGLHPKPPLPGMNTEKRDENIARAGAKTPEMLTEALVMGDFNDVPWSSTTTEFRKAGGWRDPRIGRGTYPTFPASMTWLGWPLDQIMVKNKMKVRSFEIMPNNGSDHRAVRATLCL